MMPNYEENCFLEYIDKKQEKSIFLQNDLKEKISLFEKDLKSSPFDEFSELLKIEAREIKVRFFNKIAIIYIFLYILYKFFVIYKKIKGFLRHL